MGSVKKSIATRFGDIGYSEQGSGPAALFVHVVGAVLLFAALTLEGVALRLLRRASTGMQAASWAGLLRLNRGIGPLSAVAILVPGFYMTATSWGPARRLLPPVSVDGVPMRWSLPATELGSAPARWS